MVVVIEQEEVASRSEQETWIGSVIARVNMISGVRHTKSVTGLSQSHIPEKCLGPCHETKSSETCFKDLNLGSSCGSSLIGRSMGLAPLGYSRRRWREKYQEPSISDRC